jgi:predicted transcriptional regulator of viral defense system
MTPEHPYSKKEQAVLTALTSRRRSYLSLVGDTEWLQRISLRPDLLLRRMTEKQYLQALGGGCYILGPQLAPQSKGIPGGIMTHARLSSLAPYFLSYLTGLQEHGFVPDEAGPLFAAVRGRTISRPLLVADKRKIVLTRIVTERKWFGSERVEVSGWGHYYRADLARTLVDCFDRPRISGSPELVFTAWRTAFAERRVDPMELVEYAQRLGYSVARRAGFWLSQLGALSTAVKLHEHRGSSGVVLLDASKAYGQNNWPVDRDWGLIINIPPEEHQRWMLGKGNKGE